MELTHVGVERLTKLLMHMRLTIEADFDLTRCERCLIGHCPTIFPGLVQQDPDRSDLFALGFPHQERWKYDYLEVGERLFELSRRQSHWLFDPAHYKRDAWPTDRLGACARIWALIVAGGDIHSASGELMRDRALRLQSIGWEVV